MGLLIQLEFAVHSYGAIIGGGWIVEVEIEGCEVDFFLDAVFVGHPKEVLGVHGEEEVDRSFGQFLVVEQEAANVEAAYLLQDQNDGVVLEFEGVQDPVYFVEAVELQEGRLFFGVDVFDWFLYLFGCSEQLQGELQTDPHILWVEVLSIFLHFFGDLFFCFTVGSFYPIGW